MLGHRPGAASLGTRARGRPARHTRRATRLGARSKGAWYFRPTGLSNAGDIMKLLILALALAPLRAMPTAHPPKGFESSKASPATRSSWKRPARLSRPRARSSDARTASASTPTTASCGSPWRRRVATRRTSTPVRKSIIEFGGESAHRSICWFIDRDLAVPRHPSGREDTPTHNAMWLEVGLRRFLAVFPRRASRISEPRGGH